MFLSVFLVLTGYFVRIVFPGIQVKEAVELWSKNKRDHKSRAHRGFVELPLYAYQSYPVMPLLVLSVISGNLCMRAVWTAQTLVSVEV